MKERLIEKHLVDMIKMLDGMCLKFISPSNAGVPDRLVILPSGKIIFVELKTDVGRLSKIQEHTIDEMKKRNADVRVLYGMKDVEDFLNEVKEVERNEI